MEHLSGLSKSLSPGFTVGDIYLPNGLRLDGGSISEIGDDAFKLKGTMKGKEVFVDLSEPQLVSAIRFSGLEREVLNKLSPETTAPKIDINELSAANIEEFVADEFAKPAAEFSNTLQRLLSERTDIADHINSAFDKIMHQAVNSEDAFVRDYANDRISLDKLEAFVSDTLDRISDGEQGIVLSNGHSQVLLAEDYLYKRGGARGIFFNEQGLTRDELADDFESLARIIGKEGFTQDGSSELERLSQLDKFQQGPSFIAKLQDAKSGKTSYDEFIRSSLMPEDSASGPGAEPIAPVALQSNGLPSIDAILHGYDFAIHNNESLQHGDQTLITIPLTNGEEIQYLAAVGKEGVSLDRVVLPDNPEGTAFVNHHILSNEGEVLINKRYAISDSMIQKLIEKGVDANQLQAPSPGGQTSLFFDGETPSPRPAATQSTSYEFIDTPPAAEDFEGYDAFFNAYRDHQLNNLQALKQQAENDLKTIVLSRSGEDYTSSDLQDAIAWASKSKFMPDVSQALKDQQTAVRNLLNFGDTGSKDFVTEVKELWNAKNEMSDASIADKIAAVPATPDKDDDGKIKDVGEKVPGAAKDRWVSYMTKLNMHHNMDQTTLGEFLPAPNYDSLHKKGIPKSTLALAALTIASIPVTGRGMTKRSLLSKQTQMALVAKQVMKDIITHEGSADSIRDYVHTTLKAATDLILNENPIVTDLKHELLMQSEPANFKKLQRVHFYTKGAGTTEAPMSIAMQLPNKAYSFVDNGEFRYDPYFPEAYVRENMKDAADAFLRAPKAERKKKYSKILCYTNSNQGIRYLAFEMPSPDLGRNERQLRVKEFPLDGSTYTEAMQWLADNRDQVEEQIQQAKTVTLRRAENRIREGSPWREGSIDADTFKDTFGLKYVEFGKSLSEDEKKDRLNLSYDALCDLSMVTGIHREALGMGGYLSQAFASRGTGGGRGGAPMATYSSYYRIINLTRREGAGSLAHEMFHALDHHYGLLRQHDVQSFTDPAEGVERIYASDDQGRRPNEQRPEMRDAWLAVREAIRQPELVKRYRLLDGFRKEPYLSTTIEIAARSFEKYVQLKLAEKGITNDFLVNIFENIDEGPGRAYPSTEEMHKYGMIEAFDNLFENMKTVELEKGVTLFKLPTKEELLTNAFVDAAVSTPFAFNQAMSESDSIQDHLLNYGMTPQSVLESTADPRIPDEPADYSVFVDAHGGEIGVVYVNDDRVWLDASAISSEISKRQLFQVAADFAAVNELSFAGDPQASTSTQLESLIASAIRHGSSDHLEAPFIALGSTYFNGGWSNDTDRNLNSLLQASRENVIKNFPSVEAIQYDLDSGRYISTDGEETEKLASYLNGEITISDFRVNPPAGTDPDVDWSLATTKAIHRAVLTDMLLANPEQELKASSLFTAAAKMADAGTLYRPMSGNSDEPESVSRVKDWIASTERHTGTHINVVEKTDDLPPHLARAVKPTTPGVYDIRSNKPYLVADNIKSEEHAIKTALHEGLGHSGVISFLERNAEMGGAQVMDVLDGIYNDVGPEEISKYVKAYSLNMDSLDDRREAVLEYIAHISEEKDSGHVNSLVDSQESMLENLYADRDISWNKNEILGLIEASRINMVYEETIKQAAKAGYDFSKSSPAYERAFEKVLADAGGLSSLLSKNSPSIDVWHGTSAEISHFAELERNTDADYGYGVHTSGSKVLMDAERVNQGRTTASVGGVNYSIEDLRDSYYYSDPEYTALSYYLDAGADWDRAREMINQDVTAGAFSAKASQSVTPDMALASIGALEKTVIQSEGLNLQQARLKNRFDQYLDLDKPLNDQSPSVKEALRPYLGDLHITKLAEDVLPEWKDKYLDELTDLGLSEEDIAAHSLAVDTLVYGGDSNNQEAWAVLNRVPAADVSMDLNDIYDIADHSGVNYYGRPVTGRDIYGLFQAKGITDSAEATSMFLAGLGIKGNRYQNTLATDAKSNAVEDYNFVTFNDKNVEITKSADQVELESNQATAQAAQYRGIDVSQTACLERAAAMGFPDTMYYLAKSDSGNATYTRSPADSTPGAEVLLKFNNPFQIDTQDQLEDILSNMEKVQVLKDSGFDALIAQNTQGLSRVAVLDDQQVAPADSLFINDEDLASEQESPAPEEFDLSGFAGDEEYELDSIYYMGTQAPISENDLQSIGSIDNVDGYVDQAVFITDSPVAAHNSMDLFIDDLSVYPVVVKLQNPATSGELTGVKMTIEDYLKDFPVEAVNTHENRLIGFYRSTEEQRIQYAIEQGHLASDKPTADEKAAFASPLVVRSVTADISLDRNPNVDPETGLDMSEEARMGRAEAMGYDTSRVFYHGSDKAGFKEFDQPTSPRTSGTGIFFSDTRSVAASYVDGSAPDAAVFTGRQIFDDPELIDGLEITKQYVVTDSDGDLVDMDDVDYYDSESELLENIELEDGESIQIRYEVCTPDGSYPIELATEEETVRELDAMEFTAKGVYEVYLKKGAIEDNVLTVDWKYHNWDESPTESWSLLDDKGDVLDYVHSEEEAQAAVADENNEASEFEAEPGKSTNEYAREARDAGYDGVIYKNIFDSGSNGGDMVSDIYVVFDEASIRSVNAAFDPSKSALPNILLKIDEDEIIQEKEPVTVEQLPELLKEFQSNGGELQAVVTDNQDNVFGVSVSDAGWRSPALVSKYGEHAKSMSYASVTLPGDMEGMGVRTLSEITQSLKDVGITSVSIGNTESLNVRDFKRVANVLELVPGETASNDSVLAKQLNPVPEQASSFASTRFLFAGKYADHAPLSALDEARNMEGHQSAADIQMATGWSKGSDNKWRFEIDDSKSSIDSEHIEALKIVADGNEGKNINNGELKNLLTHDELFKQYPALENMGVSFYSRQPADTSRGALIEWTEPTVSGDYELAHINLYIDQNTKTQDVHEILIHELQHFIQSVEGFARGANTDVNNLKDTLNRMIERKEIGLDTLVTREWQSLVHERGAIEDIEIYDDLVTLSKDSNAHLNANKLYETDVFSINEWLLNSQVGPRPDESNVVEYSDWVRKSASFVADVHKENFEERNRSTTIDQYRDLVTSEHGARGLSKRLREISNSLSNLKPESIRNNSLQSQIRELEEIRDTLNSDNAMSVYKRFGGEVEARNAAARLNMSAIERSIRTPKETMDISSFSEHINTTQIPKTSLLRIDSSAVSERISYSGIDTSNIKVVASTEELPAEVVELANQYNQEPAGVNHKGHVYLVAGNIRNTRELDETIIHEAAHGAVRTIFGDELSKAYDTFWHKAGGEKGMQRLAIDNGVGLQQYMVPSKEMVEKGEITEKERRTMLVDEFVAHMVTNKYEYKPIGDRLVDKAKSLVQEFIGSVRNSLRKVGLLNSDKMSNSDIAFTIKAVNDAARGKNVETPMIISSKESLASSTKATWNWMDKVRSISKDLPGAAHSMISKFNAPKAELDSMAKNKTPRLGMISMLESMAPPLLKKAFSIKEMPKEKEKDYTTYLGDVNSELYQAEERNKRAFDYSIAYELESSAEPFVIPRNDGGKVIVTQDEVSGAYEAVVVDLDGNQISSATGDSPNEVVTKAKDLALNQDNDLEHDQPSRSMGM